MNSFIFSKFNYCPLIWHFTSAISTNNVEKIQEGALKYLFDDNESSYDVLLEKSNRVEMTVYGLRTLCLEIYKTLNDLNPAYMKEIYKKSVNRHSSRLNNIEVPTINQVTYGKKNCVLLDLKFGIAYLSQ